MRSPKPSGTPFGMKVAAATGSSAICCHESLKSKATRGATRQPSSARRMAGARSSAMSRVP